MGSGRYFGFVIGGALPAALASDWLVSAWDQNTGLAQPTPALSALEAVTGRWVLDLLGLPPHCVVRVRDRLPDGARDLARRSPPGGLPPDRLRPARGGPRGAPPAPRRRRRPAPRHADARAAAARDRTQRRSVSYRWTARAECEPSCSRTFSPDGDAPTIVCGQAGEVNTGAFDDLATIVAVGARSRRLGARRRRLRALGRGEPAARPPACAGMRDADSWATDASQVAQRPLRLRHRDLRASRTMHAAAMEYAAPYLAVADSEVGTRPDGLQPGVLTPSPRSLPAWAAIRSLGRIGHRGDGRGQLRARHGDRRRASRALPGCEILNDVVPQPGAPALRERRPHDGDRGRGAATRARRG